ncbi:hypothetical protein OIU91_28265 [Streptomyces sp. NBC_01456]|uniref:hypothetical protein n=1 Tax=unclassified Streptomyces TaxID=2593676 RepID=UPI002E36D4BD|nr:MULTISPECIES: hypothetical protein [unclassified Streptomyces]
MARRYAYRCELIARNLDGTYEATLTTYRATTPRLAARWARMTAGRYAELLAPAPTASYLAGVPLVEIEPGNPRPDVRLQAWADSTELYEDVLSTLAEGRAYAFTVTDYGARYELRLDPLPIRRAPEMPAFTIHTRPSTGRGRHRRPRTLQLVP